MPVWSLLAKWFDGTAVASSRSSRRVPKPRRRGGPSRVERQASSLSIERLEAREVFDVEPGPVIVVNSSLAVSQPIGVANAVASDSAGNYVVVWHTSNQDGDGLGVFGQRFNADGEKLGSEFRVNTFTAGDQYDAAVAMNSNGEFVVVWASNINGVAIYGQRFAADGQAVGDEFTVAEPNPYGAFGVSVAINDSGEFVASYSARSYLLINTFTNVFAVQFNSDGVATAGFSIGSSHPLITDKRSNVAMDAEGNFAVTWWDMDGIGGYDVLARRYDAGDGTLGDVFTVNTSAAGVQTTPDIAMNSAGEFVIVWHGPGDGDDAGVFGRRFDAAGAALDATEFRVNTTTAASQTAPTVAMNEAGEFVVAWSTEFGGYLGLIQGQRYTATGAADGAEFTVSADVLAMSSPLHLAYDDRNQFVIAYGGYQNLLFHDVLVRSFYINYAPTDMDLSGTTVVEGAAAGAVIGTLSTTDRTSYDEHIYSFVDNPGNLFALVGNAVSVAGVGNFEAGASYDLQVRVTDARGNTHVETFTITVSNAPPTAPIDSNSADNTVSASATGGASVGIVLSASDPGGSALTYELTDDADGRFQVDPTTGEVTVVSGATFAVGETYSIVARAFDGIDYSETSSFVITADQIVKITGASGNDTIAVDLKNGVYTVKVNGTTWAETFTEVTRFEIYGLEGNDKIKISKSVLVPAHIDGGAGNDVIASGSGDDVILGGDGNDTLKGGLGQNVLIGGLGKDSIQAASGSGAALNRSIMIGDSTSHDADLDALLAISAAWQSSDLATVRTHLGQDTVLADGERDKLKSVSKNLDLLFSFESKPNGSPLDSLKTQLGDVVN